MKTMLIRVTKTFIQAAIIATIAAVSSGVTAWQAIAIAAGTAGLSAIMNMPAVKNFFNDYGEKESEGNNGIQSKNKRAK